MREWITTAEAAELRGRSRRTMTARCLDHEGLCRRDGRAWLVSRVALSMLEYDDTGGLCDYAAGDRSSPRVTKYFDKLGIVRDT